MDRQKPPRKKKPPFKPLMLGRMQDKRKRLMRQRSALTKEITKARQKAERLELERRRLTQQIGELSRDIMSVKYNPAQAYAPPEQTT